MTIRKTNGWNWVVAVCVLLSTVAHAKATIVTLSELTKQSQVIVYGHLAVAAESSSPSSQAWLQFKAVLVVKGASSVRENVIQLCNSRPNLEWPDMSKMAGDTVLFVSQKGDCFDLSHNYRSVVRVRDGRATTGEIKDQPEDQPLDMFLNKVRSLVSRQAQAGR